MSPDHDSRFSSGDEPDEHFEDEDAPRSIFSAAWFRVVLVVLAVAVVGAVAVPYVLDVVNAPSSVPATGTAAAPQSPTPQSPTAQSPTAQSPTPSSMAQPSTSSAPAPASGPAAAAPSSSAPKTATPSEGTSTPPSSAPTVSTPVPEKAPAVAATPKPAAPRAAAAKKDPAASPGDRPAGARQAPAAKASEGGDYFVQVGAFKEEEAAKRVATRLRDQNYPVEESVRRVGGGGGAPSAAPRSTPRATASSGGPDRYDVIVSGGSASEINSKLAAKGLASEAAGDGVRIRPSLSLRDAVALSKDLGGDGFKVQVRRGSSAGAPTAEPAPAPAVTGSETGGGQTLYRVRVGGYPDRAAAVTVQRELQEKGYQPYIAKGRE